MRMVPMVDQYILTTSTYSMEMTTRPSHLRHYYKTSLNPTLVEINAVMNKAAPMYPGEAELKKVRKEARWKGMADALCDAALVGI